MNSEQTKHWSEYLPEAGRMITNRANEILSAKAEAEDLAEQITRLEREIEEKELALLDLVKTEWKDKEISEAKHQWLAEKISTNPKAH